MVFVTIDGVKVIDGLYALIDTGADYTIINSQRIAEFKPQLRPIDKTPIQDCILRQAKEHVFLATVEIEGLCDPVPIYVVEKDCDRHPLLVGRNLLERYRLVYDPTKSEYSLTKPESVPSILRGIASFITSR